MRALGICAVYTILPDCRNQDISLFTRYHLRGLDGKSLLL